MPKAVITLDDQDGQIGMTVFFEGGYQPDSNAHQHTNLIIKYLDSIAEGMKSEGEAKWVSAEDAQAILEAETTPIAQDSSPRGLILVSG